MAVDAALDIKEKGDLNNNYERHKNELYKAHQYWRMDRARVAALAFAAGDSAGAGGPPGAAWGPPFNYTTMVWLRPEQEKSDSSSLQHEYSARVPEKASTRRERSER